MWITKIIVVVCVIILICLIRNVGCLMLKAQKQEQKTKTIIKDILNEQ